MSTIYYFAMQQKKQIKHRMIDLTKMTFDHNRDGIYLPIHFGKKLKLAISFVLFYSICFSRLQ